MERALNSMYPQELRQLMEDIDFPKYRGDQLFNFFHVQKLVELSLAGNIPKALIRKLSEFPVGRGQIVHSLLSNDGTRKFLIRFDEHSIIETVFMPYEDRNTLCLSSQVGCRMGCLFCASTKANFVRNLTADEMLLEVYLVEKALNKRVDNIVIMGIGEPFDNYDELVRFLKLITHEKGKNLSARSITISTSGIVPHIYKLADEGLQVNLAISLHASNDRDRAETMPIARRYKISEIKEACSYYFSKTGRRISLEYVVIKGKNDRKEDVERLVKEFRGSQWHFNLIGLNHINEFDGQALEHMRMQDFCNTLKNRGLNATIRNRRGADIEAACGQLRINYQRGEAKYG